MRELSLLIAEEFRHLESESESTTLNFLKEEKREMKQTTYVTLEINALTDLSPRELFNMFHQFLEGEAKFKTHRDRELVLNVVDSRFTSIATIDDDEVETEHLTDSGNLIVNDLAEVI